jgi:hypothetical protein
MKIESTEYTADDFLAVLETMRDHDRQMLADRLQRADDRLTEVATRVKPGRSDGDEWSAVEVLAHIATRSKFFGVMVHRVVSGQVTDLHMLDAVHLRDNAIDQLADQDPSELLRMTLADHARTIKELRTADLESLRRSAALPQGGTITAEEIARVQLISHIETHIDQLEKTLGS